MVFFGVRHGMGIGAGIVEEGTGFWSSFMGIAGVVSGGIGSFRPLLVPISSFGAGEHLWQGHRDVPLTQKIRRNEILVIPLMH